MRTISTIITAKAETKSKAVLLVSDHTLTKQDYIEAFQEFLEERKHLTGAEICQQLTVRH